MMRTQSLLLLALVGICVAQYGRPFYPPAVRHPSQALSPPNPTACAERARHASALRNGHYYFFSWRHPLTFNQERDWLYTRNICRKNCQELVSLETEDEAKFIYKSIEDNSVKFIWTSGRKCNFAGCERPDFQPSIVNGWFWSGSSTRIPPTNFTLGWRGDWSNTGGGGVPQPDNRELSENGRDESCIGVLNNFYNDGIKWHDIACHHQKSWVCEDSDELLAYTRINFPRIFIP